MPISPTERETLQAGDELLCTMNYRPCFTVGHTYRIIRVQETPYRVEHIVMCDQGDEPANHHCLSRANYDMFDLTKAKGPW